MTSRILEKAKYIKGDPLPFIEEYLDLTTELQLGLISVPTFYEGLVLLTKKYKLEELDK